MLVSFVEMNAIAQKKGKRMLNSLKKRIQMCNSFHFMVPECPPPPLLPSLQDSYLYSSHSFLCGWATPTGPCSLPRERASPSCLQASWQTEGSLYRTRKQLAGTPVYLKEGWVQLPITSAAGPGQWKEELTEGSFYMPNAWALSPLQLDKWGGTSLCFFFLDSPLMDLLCVFPRGVSS